MPSLHGALKHLEVYRREIAIPKYFASLMLLLWPPKRARFGGVSKGPLFTL
jgi:hypothetical protein